MKRLSLILILACGATQAINADECQNDGQYVIDPHDDGYQLERCYEMGSGTYDMRPNISADDLIKALKEHGGDQEFINSFKAMGIGGDSTSPLSATEQYSVEHPVLSILGDSGDRATLALMATKLNEYSGVTAKIAQAKERGLRDREQKIKPISLDQKTFLDIARKNSVIAEKLEPSTCRNDSNDEKKLQLFQIEFEDGGDPGLILPVGAKEVGKDTIEFESPNYATGLGGLQLVKGNLLPVRQLIFENGKIVWVSPDGKQYPVKSIHSWTSSDGLGFNRPVGTSANGPFDVCEYAQMLHPAKSGDKGSSTKIQY